MEQTEYISVHRSGVLARIQLMRSDKRNALNEELVAQLKAAIAELEQDTEIRVVILFGDAKAFCAGADLGYLQQLQKNTRVENIQDSLNLKNLYQRIYESRKIYIAQVEGPALAGGCGLASVCDYIFATPEASFGYTESRIGFIPAIVMVFLLRKLGEGKARHLLLSGDILNGEEAFLHGLVFKLVPASSIAEEVENFALKLAKQTSPDSIARIKQMISKVQDLPLEEALMYAAGQNAEARESPDCRRGIAAFLNKERIQW